MRNLKLSTQLLITWLLYNVALIVILILTCYRFSQNEYDTIFSIALFSLGLSVMQYDWWALTGGKYQRKIKEVY